jgi:hypothetical protein
MDRGKRGACHSERSEALLHLVKRKKQILRFAQDDIGAGLVPQPV